MASFETSTYPPNPSLARARGIKFERRPCLPAPPPVDAAGSILPSPTRGLQLPPRGSYRNRFQRLSLGRSHSLLSRSLISVTQLQLTRRQLPSLNDSAQSRLSRDPFLSQPAVMKLNASAASNNANPKAFQSTMDAVRSSRPSLVWRHIRQTDIFALDP